MTPWERALRDFRLACASRRGFLTGAQAKIGSTRLNARGELDARTREALELIDVGLDQLDRIEAVLDGREP